MTRAIFGGVGVGLLDRFEVGDLGVISGMMPSSSINNSCTTGVEVEGKGTGVWVPRIVLAKAGGIVVLVVTSSKFKLRWGVRLGASVVIFCFLSWDVAISFALSLGCARERLFNRDVCVPGVGSTSAVGSVGGLWC